MSKGQIVDTFGKPWDEEDVYDYAKRVSDLTAKINFTAGFREGASHQYKCYKNDHEFNDKMFMEG